MSYTRVIPRDFFNEAKLLKCMGILSLKILDGMLPEGISISIYESGEPFQIELDDCGDLRVMNYPIEVNGEEVIFFTAYNSKNALPFYAYINDEPVLVFTNTTEFTNDFISAVSLMAA